jgi:hypothetical protein
MLYRANVAICPEINTKYKYNVAEYKFLNVKPVGAPHNQ